MNTSVSTKETNHTTAEYIVKYGSHSSIALLDTTYKFFKLTSIDGIIGYRMESKCIVVFGDPVCSSENIAHLTTAFHDFCQKQGKNVVYIATSEKFTQWAVQNLLCTALDVGYEIILDPTIDPKSRSGRKASQLRNKYQQSVRNNINVKEYQTHNTILEHDIKQFEKKWLQSRRGPQIYNLKVDIFAGKAYKRLFYAEHNNRIVAVLILNRLETHHGWVLNISMTLPDAPNTISEFMILSVLDQLRKEECRFLSMGSLPPDQIGSMQGLGFFTMWLVQNLFKIIKKIFKLNNRQKYWEKFQPQLKPSYMVLGNPKIGLSEIIGILRAVNVI